MPDRGGADRRPPLTPEPDCPLCPRLRALRLECRADHPDWHAAPVPSFGPLDAPILIVGLAPGLRGANRTGRPFTGDFAGVLLYETLLETGLAAGVYRADPGDGLVLSHCRITNAVRCVPPDNKPARAEIEACRRFLASELAAMPGLCAILALGSIAHEAVLACFSLRRSAFAFAHGARHDLPGGMALIDSYHCSRLNTNTGRLTPAMFQAAVAEAAAAAGVAAPSRLSPHPGTTA
jgi:uracil-DNA glycosylase family 4